MRTDPTNHPPPDLVEEISGLLQNQLLVNVEAPEDDLLASGALDSLTLIQLLVQLEERFSITIPLAELELDDVRSIQAITRMVQARRSYALSAASGANVNR